MEQLLNYVFQNTQCFLWENDSICQSTSQAVLNTRVIPENYDVTRIMGSIPTEILVTEEKTLQAAERLSRKYVKVGILNFANAVNPGGSVSYGGSGQEEVLCCCTNLYPCLMKPELYRDFYGYNNRQNQYYSDKIIYSPGITVFRDDAENFPYRDQWYQIDVLSCPPPNLNGLTVYDYQKLEKLYRRRFRNILAAAETNGIQALVLGAFGCEKFGNPPELVAKAFWSELTEGDYANSFWEVVFAIHSENAAGVYYGQIFRSVISPWKRKFLEGKKISVLSDGTDSRYLNEIMEMGGEILTDNSCMGSMVSGNNLCSGNSDYRLYQLAGTYEQPDMILISMGKYDWENGIPLEDKKRQVSGDYYQNYFRESYEVMLWKLQQLYPQTIVCCCTLEDMGSMKKYNCIIRECAKDYGCYVAEQGELDTEERKGSYKKNNRNLLFPGIIYGTAAVMIVGILCMTALLL